MAVNDSTSALAAAPADQRAVAPPASDAELIASVRGGDRAAFAELYARHSPAATVVARQYAPRAADAEDIVSETFARVFRLLGEGKGPDSFFRAYVFTAVRHLAASYGQASQRVELSDDQTVFEDAAGAVQDDPSESILDRQIVREAFASLPERWRTALWYAEVEGLSTSQMAPALGLTPNGVAALLYRAREGLRQAYLQQHLAKPLDAECRAIAGRLGAYARGALGQRERGRVAEHLVGCDQCRAVADEAHDVNRGLRGVIAPLVLGSAPGLSAMITAIGNAPPVPAGLPAAAPAGPAPTAANPAPAPTPTPAPAPTAPAAPLPGAETITGGASQIAAVAVPVATKSGVTGTMAIASAAVVAIIAGGVVLANRPAPVASPDPTSPPAVSSASAPPAALPLRPTAAQGDTMALAFSGDGPLDITLAGAPLPECPADEAAGCPASSAAEVVLPADAEVRYATLAWASNAPGEGWTAVTLVSPDGTGHRVDAEGEFGLLEGAQSTADVTDVVASAGGGEWRVDGLAREPHPGIYAGWSLTVVYAAPGLPERRASVYQGALRVEAGTGKELDVDAPLGLASHLGFVAWGASPARTGSDIWMSSGTGQEAVSQELVPDPFRGSAAGYSGPPAGGTDVFALDKGVEFPRAENAGTAVTLRVRAWGDANQSDPFTLGAVTLVTDLPRDSLPHTTP
ncbi:MAG: sigma-70 family RNA polymerase sigma factor [Bifidobacteriaceae bacterium]|jgi:RNA polymerase sigma factor (sigma-70 family)|nr:sigma-70 family RNA polymerase sigma factor [Bifidobacteriaceae bacterium]